MCPYLNKICFEQVLRRQFQKITPTKVKRKIGKKSQIKNNKKYLMRLKIFLTVYLVLIYLDMLFILTSKWVLCTRFAGQNNVFGAKTTFLSFSVNKCKIIKGGLPAFRSYS